MNIIEILQQIFSATDEQTNAFSEAMKTNGIYTTAHENMDVRYPKMKANYETSQRELGEAKNRMAEMQTAAEGQADLQAQIQQLQAENTRIKLESAIKVGLLKAKAKDVGYLTYKLQEKLNKEGRTLSMDDNDDIKGWDDLLEGMKTQLPEHFESAGDNDDGYDVYKPNSLRKPDKNEQPITSLKNMNYEQRLALKEKNPTLYKKLSGNQNN